MFVNEMGFDEWNETYLLFSIVTSLGISEGSRRCAGYQLVEAK